MDDLVQWLRAQLDEDERIAREALRYVDAGWRWDGEENVTLASGMTAAGEQMVAITADRWRRSMVEGPGVVEHVAEWDPARALREIDAKRQNLAELKAAEEAMDQAARDRDTARYNAVRAEWAVLKRVILRDAAIYADRPGYRDDWRP